MSIPVYDTQRTFFDTAVVAANLFGPTDRFTLFRELALPAVEAQREKLCALYCQENGRPGIEPVVMACSTLLQFMDKLPDRAAAEAVRLNLGWKHALDLPVDYEGFHPTSLVKFRNRLQESDAGRLVFDALLRALEEAGLLPRRGTQRLDSTHVLGCVSKMSRLEVVRETLRLFVQAMDTLGFSGAVPHWDELIDRYVNCEIQWHRASTQTLQEKFLEAGGDMHALLAWAREQEQRVREHAQTKLLERVFSEQYELNEGAIERRINEGSGVVKNPHDPEAQWAAKDAKKTKQWVGYKVQVAETVDPEAPPKKKGEPTEQFLTEVTTTEAITSDMQGRRELEQQQQKHGLGAADTCYVDGAYVNAADLADVHEQGRELMGPAPSSPKPKGKAIFPVEDFDVDIAGSTAVCPAGHPSRQCSSLTNPQTGKVQYRFEWGSLCDHCELRDRCTRARDGRRSIVVGEHHEHLQRRRKEMKTEGFATRMHARNGIEGTISEFTRGGGRRTRYRGLAKTALANYFLAAAINVKRWIRLKAAERKPQNGGSRDEKRSGIGVGEALATLLSARSGLGQRPNGVLGCAA